jgi:hypothetical protein
LRIKTNKKIKNILQGEDAVKRTKSLQFRWYGHVDRIQKQRMPKQTVALWKEQEREEDNVKNAD